MCDKPVDNTVDTFADTPFLEVLHCVFYSTISSTVLLKQVPSAEINYIMRIASLLLSVGSVLCAEDYVVPTVWPMPAETSFGKSSVFVSKSLIFSTNDGADVKTLNDAYARYHELVFTHEFSAESGSPMASNVVVTVKDISEEYPQLDSDESYSLTVSEKADIEITANTVYGVMYGLETLSQLVVYDYDEGVYFIPSAPVAINDAPRYPHRGLLLDTSRHFQPIAELKRTIDSLSYAKYNGKSPCYLRNCSSPLTGAVAQFCIGMWLTPKVSRSNQTHSPSCGKVRIRLPSVTARKISLHWWSTVAVEVSR